MSQLFAENFRIITEVLGNAQENKDSAIAAKFNLDPSTFSRIKGGGRSVNLEYLKYLRENKSINLNWLLANDGPPLKPLYADSQSDPEPFICHLLIQKSLHPLSSLFINFFFKINEAVSLETQDHMPPPDMGISHMLAEKHAREASSIMCFVSNGHDKIVDKWKEIAIADDLQRKNRMDARVLYAVTANGERYVSKIESLKRAQRDGNLYMLRDKKQVKKLLAQVLIIRSQHKMVNWKPEHFTDEIESISNDIVSLGTRKVVFLAGSVPKHIAFVNALPAENINLFKEFVFWSNNCDIQKNDTEFQKKYQSRLETFTQSLCDEFARHGFIVCASALVPHVGKIAINHCRTHNYNFEIEGMFSNDMVNEDEEVEKLFQLERVARKNYLTNKDGLVILGGNTGTQQDLIAAQELNQNASHNRQAKIKIMPIPCMGGIGTEAYMHKGSIHIEQCKYCCANHPDRGIFKAHQCCKEIVNALEY
ncbi:MAG: hypothetical protein GF398_15860 [Chitinivibrionales bacterium]|nr:hypothetical protein [Chitinivibrionales bacterium]